MKITFPLTVILFISLLVEASGQDLRFSSNEVLKLSKIEDSYQKAKGENLNLYNGAEHIPYPYKISNGHVYFQQDSWTNGRVVYEDQLFENFPVLYDLLNDDLIIQHFNKYSKITLHHEMVSGFTIHGRKFIRLESSAKATDAPVTGFYEVIYAGNMMLFAKRAKRIEETTSVLGVDRKVYQSNRYYLLKEGKYSRINNSRDLLFHFGNKKKPVGNFLKKSKISFKRQREEAFIRAIKFYEQGI